MLGLGLLELLGSTLRRGRWRGRRRANAANHGIITAIVTVTRVFNHDYSLLTRTLGHFLTVFQVLKFKKGKKKNSFRQLTPGVAKTMDSAKVLFHVTGFGAFNGVPVNPTTLLCEESLPSLYPSLPPTVVIGSTTVLPVHCEAASAYCSRHAQEALPLGFAHTVYLHCGVSAGSKVFALEACGWNSCDFRVPDENGAQPRNEPILSDLCGAELPHSAPLRTSLALPAILAALQPAWGHCTVLSEDPGRFLCNFLFFKSLHACASRAQGVPGGPWQHALFLHVPPESAIDLATQARFVVDLIRAIAGSLSGEATPAALAGEAANAARAAPPLGTPLACLLELGFEEAASQRALAALGEAAELDALVAYIVEGAQAEASRGGGGGEGGGGGGSCGGAPAVAQSQPSLLTFDLGAVLGSLGAASSPQRLKMTCIVRGDLSMSSGKVGSQVAHAVLGAYRAALGQPSAAADVRAWERTGEKIVLLSGEKGERGLRAALAQAQQAGIPCAVCRDAGRTEVEPGTLTVAAIGPASEERIDAITGKLRLL